MTFYDDPNDRGWEAKMTYLVENWLLRALTHYRRLQNSAVAVQEYRWGIRDWEDYNVICRDLFQIGALLEDHLPPFDTKDKIKSARSARHTLEFATADYLKLLRETKTKHIAWDRISCNMTVSEVIVMIDKELENDLLP